MHDVCDWLPSMGSVSVNAATFDMTASAMHCIDYVQTVVLVVDSGEGFNKKMIPTNVMNLNIGKNVDLQLPSQFWLRLTNKLGMAVSRIEIIMLLNVLLCS